jgi:hypothetical protein
MRADRRCERCAGPMRMVNQGAAGPVLLYWCSLCQRFAEVIKPFVDRRVA